MLRKIFAQIKSSISLNNQIKKAHEELETSHRQISDELAKAHTQVDDMLDRTREALAKSRKWNPPAH